LIETISAIAALSVKICAVALMSLSESEANTPNNPVFRGVNGGFVAISVPDLEASARWYVEKLDLEIVKQATSADKKSAVTILRGNGLDVELIWLADAVSLSKVAPELKGTQQSHGIFKSGVFVDDLDSELKQLKSRNVTFAFEPFFYSSMQCRMFAIRDNDGNLLQFFGK